MRRTLFALLTVFVASGCLCGGCKCPADHGYPSPQKYREAEMNARRQKAQPVIDALGTYKEKHEKYPEKLDALVAEKFLDAIPDFTDKTDHQGQPGRIDLGKPLGYRTADDRSEFALGFDVTFSEKGLLDFAMMRAWYNSRVSGWEYEPRTYPPDTKKTPATAR